MDKKRVNVKICGPIYTVNPPITRTVLDTELSVGDIRNCICAKATVEEILNNGKIIRLDLYNYNKDNQPKKTVTKPTTAQPKKSLEVSSTQKQQDAVNVTVVKNETITKNEQVKVKEVKPAPIAEEKTVEDSKQTKPVKEEVKAEKPTGTPTDKAKAAMEAIKKSQETSKK